jgi:hypothetical protein
MQPSAEQAFLLHITSVVFATVTRHPPELFRLSNAFSLYKSLLMDAYLHVEQHVNIMNSLNAHSIYSTEYKVTGILNKYF